MVKRRLEIEAIPESCFFSNLRKLLPRKRWDEIRVEAYVEHLDKCAICGIIPDKGKLHAHEWWLFQDDTWVQELGKVVALCNLCHMAKHPIKAFMLIDEGRMDYGEYVGHYCEVNDCYESDFIEDLKVALGVFAERSKHEWILKIGDYIDEVKEEFTESIEQGKVIR
jgi:hypothetical protein